jgi:hypothetical protein
LVSNQIRQDHELEIQGLTNKLYRPLRFTKNGLNTTFSKTDSDASTSQSSKPQV